MPWTSYGTAQGIFEAQPGTGTGTYIFSAPMFPEDCDHTADGHKTTINAPGGRDQ